MNDDPVVPAVRLGALERDMAQAYKRIDEGSMAIGELRRSLETITIDNRRGIDAMALRFATGLDRVETKAAAAAERLEARAESTARDVHAAISDQFASLTEQMDRIRPSRNIQIMGFTSVVVVLLGGAWTASRMIAMTPDRQEIDVIRQIQANSTQDRALIRMRMDGMAERLKELEGRGK